MKRAFPKIKNEAEYINYLQSGTRLLTVGNPEGTFVSFLENPIGGQQIRFKSNDYLTCIQIGNTAYGGTGGSWSAPYQLPANGQFLVENIWFANGSVSNMTLLISDTYVSVGNGSHKAVLFDASTPSPGLTVLLAGLIYDNEWVNQISFTLVS